MFFAWDIEVLAGTTEDDPKTQTLKLTKGVITGLDVVFAPGCHRLVKTRLLIAESQLIPLSRDEWCTGDGEAVKTEPYYEMLDEPLQLKFIGAAPLTAYNHTITVRVRMQPFEVAAPWAIFRDFVKIVKKLIGID